MTTHTALGTHGATGMDDGVGPGGDGVDGRLGARGGDAGGVGLTAMDGGGRFDRTSLK